MTEAKLAARVREALNQGTGAEDAQLAGRLASGAQRRISRARRRRTTLIAGLSFATAVAGALVIISLVSGAESKPAATRPLPAGAQWPGSPQQAAPPSNKRQAVAERKALDAKRRELANRERELDERERLLIERERVLKKRQQELLEEALDTSYPLDLSNLHGGEFTADECVNCHRPATFRPTSCDELTCLVEPSWKCCAMKRDMEKERKMERAKAKAKAAKAKAKDTWDRP